nr:hypothetical protein [Tanacetum cinerariifolium]
IIALAKDGRTQRFLLKGGILFTKGDRLYVPKWGDLRRAIMKECYNSKWTGHPRITKTLALVEGTYYWPRMGDDVKTFVRTCLICQQDKIEQKKSGGFLEPLPSPKGPWESVSMDFITCFPKSKGGGSIIVVVDRFSKYGTFIAAPPDVTADDTAKLFFKNVAVMEEPVLRLPDITMPFEFYTDASEFDIRGVLMQDGHPITFESQKLKETERKYTVQGKEMTAKLSPKQASWQDFLAKFDYQLEYKLGKANVVADTLSRKAKTQRFLLKGGILFTKGDRLYVPKWGDLRRAIMKECYNSKWTGHPRITKTLALVEGTYYWPRMGDDVKTFVRTCLICQQDKIEQKKSGGFLEPLPSPKGPWESVSMDFITCFPKSKGGGSIIVVVDRFSKYGTFIAAPPDVTADDTAKLFFKNVTCQIVRYGDEECRAIRSTLSSGMTFLIVKQVGKRKTYCGSLWMRSRDIMRMSQRGHRELRRLSGILWKTKEALGRPRSLWMRSRDIMRMSQRGHRELRRLSEILWKTNEALGRPRRANLASLTNRRRKTNKVRRDKRKSVSRRCEIDFAMQKHSKESVSSEDYPEYNDLEEAHYSYRVVELQWTRIVNDMLLNGKLNNYLAVCDVSFSMEGTLMEVSMAFRVLAFELSEEPWKGHLITFSVKGVGRVSFMKSKSKVTGKSDSPKNRWIPMSESGEVIKESDKAPAVKEKLVDVIEKSTVVKESNKASVVKDNDKLPVVKESDKAPVVVVVVIEKSVAVIEKENPKVTSKVSTGKSLDVFKYKRKTELSKDNQKDKESDKVPVVAAIVSEKSVVDEKDNQKVTSKVSKVSYESDKATVVAHVLKEKPSDVIEKSTVVKESDKAHVVKESEKVLVVKESDKAPVVATVLKEKLADVFEKSTVVNEKEKVAVDVTSKVAKDKEKLAVDVTSKVGKSKVAKDKALDVVSKDKPKGNPPSVVGKGTAPSIVGKEKDKPSIVKGKVPTELSKKKHKADIPKDKPKPKDKHKVDSEVHVLRFKPKVKAKASVFEDVKRKRMLSKEDRSKKKLGLKMIKGFSSFHNLSIDKIPSRLGRYALSKFSSTTYRLTFETDGYVEVTPLNIHDILGIPVGGISLFSLDVRPIEYEFVRSWVDQFYPKSLKEIRVGDIASKVNSAQQVDFLFKVNFLTLFTNTMGRVAAEEKVVSICPERVFLEYLMRKASSGYPGDQKFVELQEKYVQVFRDPISFDVDVNSIDGGNDSDGDDDNDDGNGNNNEKLNDDNDDGNGNNDEELNDEDTLGSNPSFSFSKIGLDDLQPSQEEINAEKESVDPTQKGTIVELNPAEDCEIMGTPENYTQWLERNADLVGEIIDAITDEYLYGDLFGDNYMRMEVSNQGLPTPDRMPTRASNVSTSPGKRIVKPSSYFLFPYMNKKTKVVPKITRMEFSVGNSLFAMLGDKIQNLCLMVHCLLMMTNGEASQIKLRLSLKAMKMVWLFKALTCTTSMTILDNSVVNYDTKYKEVCNLLKKLFVRHLKLYGHSRYGTDCGLSVESGLQCDMLRRLRFKFATKILLHEINVHSKKMLELANEFDKVDSLERMAIIIEAVKNREERDRI